MRHTITMTGCLAATIAAAAAAPSDAAPNQGWGTVAAVRVLHSRGSS